MRVSEIQPFRHRGHPPAQTHLPVLDGLRGVAVLVVVISHCANAGLLPGILGNGFGQMGVGLFYALSGALMGRLYLHRPLDRGSLHEYGLRRATRVLPLYFLMLAVGVALTALNLSPYRLEGPGDVLRAAALIHGTGVLWSIPVEIQFYVVFVAIWAMARRGRLIQALLGLAVLQVAIVATIVAGPWAHNTYTLPFWLHFFLIGTFLGHLSTRIHVVPQNPRIGWALRALVWGILAVGVLAPPGIRQALGIPTTHAFLDPFSVGYPVLLLVLALALPGALQGLARPALRWLGKVSFSVYLIHMPVLVIVQAGAPGWLAPAGLAIVVVGLSLAISALTESLVETGARRAILGRGPIRPQRDVTRPPRRLRDA